MFDNEGEVLVVELGGVGDLDEHAVTLSKQNKHVNIAKTLYNVPLQKL